VEEEKVRLSKKLESDRNRWVVGSSPTGGAILDIQANHSLEWLTPQLCRWGVFFGVIPAEFL